MRRTDRDIEMLNVSSKQHFNHHSGAINMPSAIKELQTVEERTYEFNIEHRQAHRYQLSEWSDHDVAALQRSTSVKNGFTIRKQEAVQLWSP